MSKRWLWHGLKFVGIAALVIAALGYSVMLLWNWLVPELFAGHPIGFWQAVGLLVLSKILVGGLRGGGYRGYWRARMMERWSSMSEEERTRFRSAVRHRCGRPETGSQSAGS